MQTIHRDVLVSQGKNYILELTICHIDGEDQIRYTTYGIKLTNDKGDILLQLADVSTSRAFVENFIDLCVENDVSPMHIKDLLEDYLD